MSNTNTGGPAFPCDEIHDQHPWDESGIYRHQKAEQGMTLRDYFAAKAMQSAFSEGVFTFTLEDYRRLAKVAYAMADAMLKARETV